MTRPIKFRAWCKKEQIMHYGGFSIHATGNIEPFPGIGPKDPIVMQFTGLLDSKGKEIYEGDVVFIPGKLEKFDETGVVESIPGGFQIKGGKYLLTYFQGTSSEFWEVKGNIYENPDLIK